MNDRRDALPVEAVLRIVGQRERRQARARALAAPGAGFAVAVMASALVVAVHVGRVPDPALQPAAGPLTTTSAPARPPDVRLSPDLAALIGPESLTGDFLPTLASAAPQGQRELPALLAETWQIPQYPEAEAILNLAAESRVTITTDVGDRATMISFFRSSGYDDDDAAALAEVWRTDTDSAMVIAAILLAVE